MKKIIAYIMILCLSVSVAWARKKSAKPRMVEVEEAVWIQLNKDLMTLKDELLKTKAKLEIAQAEIKRLQAELAKFKKGITGQEVKTYVVREGDTLWTIAEKFYKDPYKWLWIFKANIDQIKDPDSIYPQQVLIIPRY